MPLDGNISQREVFLPNTVATLLHLWFQKREKKQVYASRPTDLGIV